MEVGTFWEYQGVIDFLYIILTVALLLLLPILSLFSTFKAFLFAKKKSSQRAEDFALLLGHFMAPRIFSFMLLCLNAVLGASLVSFLLLKYEYLSWALSTKEISLFTLIFALVIITFSFWRNICFALWSSIFMLKEESLLLFRDYSILAYIRVLAQAIFIFLALLPLDREILLYTLIAAFSLLILTRIAVLIRILIIRIELCFTFFAYICTNELLPLAILYLIGRHIYRHNYLVLLFEYL